MLGVGQVGDVRHHARDGQAHAGAAALGVIAVVPGRVLHDRLAADLVEGDRLRAFARGGGHRDQAPHEGRELDAPLQHLHAAHGAADDGVKRRQAEVVEQQLLRAHHVADRDEREGEAERAAGRGVDRRRPGRALAPAEHVGAEHVEAARVDRLAGADEVVPPAGLGVGERVHAGAMVVAAQRVADEDRVVARGVERAVGLVPQREAGQRLAAFKSERLRVDEVPRLDEADLANRRRPVGDLLRVVHLRLTPEDTENDEGGKAKSAS